MNYIIKLSIVLLVIWSTNFSFLCAQNANQTLEIAHKQYLDGCFEEAVSNFRRVLFFEPQLSGQIYQELGECYLQTKNYTKARYYFNTASNIAANDSLKTEIQFRIVASYILEDKLAMAENELLGFDVVQNSYLHKMHAFYYGTILFKKQNIDAAYQQFKVLTVENDTTILYLLFKKAKKINSKKPVFAMALSVGLPGLGQVYAGDWKDGLNSFILNCGTTALYFYVIKNYSLLDAVISIMPWWHRYYVGGFNNAKKKVEVRKKEKLNQVLLQIYELQLSVFNPVGMHSNPEQ